MYVFISQREFEDGSIIEGCLLMYTYLGQQPKCLDASINSVVLITLQHNYSFCFVDVVFVFSIRAYLKSQSHHVDALFFLVFAIACC